MITVLFGLAGAGKNYVGQILSQNSNFYFWDADGWITVEMLSCIQQNAAFTQEIIDQYFSLTMDHLETLKMQYDNIVISQAFYKNKNRHEFLSRFPESQFIQVRADFEIIHQRLARNKNSYSLDYLKQISINFEEPNHPSFLIDNQIESNDESLVAQFMTIPNLAKHIKVPRADQTITKSTSANLFRTI